jgi:hypothetical protein
LKKCFILNYGEKALLEYVQHKIQDKELNQIGGKELGIVEFRKWVVGLICNK